MIEELERTVLHEIVELHPERLTIAELVLRIARDPGDGVVEDRIRIATRELRQSGLARYRNDDEVVEPTCRPASVCAAHRVARRIEKGLQMPVRDPSFASS